MEGGELSGAPCAGKRAGAHTSASSRGCEGTQRSRGVVTERAFFASLTRGVGLFGLRLTCRHLFNLNKRHADIRKGGFKGAAFLTESPRKAFDQARKRIDGER